MVAPVLGVIPVAHAPRLHQGERLIGARTGGDVDVVHLVGLRALRLDQHEPARARPAEADVEQLVGFVQDARVRGLVSADDVAPNLIRPVCVVLRGVVHLPVAGGGVAVAPADAAGGAFDHIRHVLSGDEVLEPHFVRLVA